MKSGSKEIQKTMQRQVPRINMGMKEWIGQVAKHYEITYTKAENLYYRSGHSIPNTVYVKLLSNSPAIRPSITTDNLSLKAQNEALQIQLKEALKRQENLDGNFKRMVTGLLVLCQSFETGSNMGNR